MKKRIVKLIFVLFAAVWLYLLLRFTLFDAYFGRSGGTGFIFSDAGTAREYLAGRVNPVPFATIGMYVRAIFTHELSPSAIVTNLLGNLLAFAPLGVFLPMFFRRCRRFSRFVLACALCVIAVELAQLVLITGACDVDDLILNVLGACAVFGVMKLLRRRTAKVSVRSRSAASSRSAECSGSTAARRWSSAAMERR